MLMIKLVSMHRTKVRSALWIALGRLRCSRAVLYTATYENHECLLRYLKMMGFHKAHLFSIILNGLFCQS